MPSRSIIVIGAGIGGLSTACYAQMNGYRVRVLEQGRSPGGVCTSWSRQGFVFDGCIHNLAGSSPGSSLHAMWQQLGVIPAREMLAYDELVQVERSDGEPWTVYADLDRLEAHTKSLAPEDTATIDEWLGLARGFLTLDMLALPAAGPRERLRALAKLPGFIRWSGVTLDRFAQKFRSPFLRAAFPTILYDWPQQPLSLLAGFMAGLHRGDLGWPVGGSAKLARAIEARLLGLGGEIRYEAPVASILVERERAVGVRLEDGSEERADIVVSNAYGPATIFEMLGGRYTNRAIRRYYASPVDRIEMGIHVSIGLNRDLSREPHAIVWPLARPAEIAGEMRDHLYVEPFGFDRTLAPAGKSPLKVVFATSYGQWDKLAGEPERYEAAKRQIGETVIELLEPRFPGIAEQAEVVDVATPITTQRFTRNGRGFRFSVGRMARELLTGRHLSQTLPGLGSFYMVGQYAGTPGVPMVAAMGKQVAEAICRSDGRKLRVES